MAKIPEKAKFIWKHIGNLRKYIVIWCLFMTKATDFLTDKMKERVAYLIPDWSWQTWLILALVLTVAFLIEEAYYQSQLMELRDKPFTDLPNRGNSLPIGAIILILLAGASTDGNRYWRAHHVAPSSALAIKIDQSAPRTSAPVVNDSATVDAGKSKDKPKRAVSNLPKKEISQNVPPSTAPSVPPGSLVQNNSGGINVQQGTTGANSPIVNSPITIGDIPKRISARDKVALEQFLRNAKAKATIGIVADQYSGGSQFPDDFYEVLKDGGWPMQMGGVNRYMGFSAPGKRFQGVVITVRGEPLAAGESVFTTESDPLFYIGKVVEALGLERSLRRIKDSPEGVITIDFEGGFSN